MRPAPGPSGAHEPQCWSPMSARSLCHATLTSKIELCNLPEKELRDLCTCSAFSWATTQSLSDRPMALGKLEAPMALGKLEAHLVWTEKGMSHRPQARPRHG